MVLGPVRTSAVGRRVAVLLGMDAVHSGHAILARVAAFDAERMTTVVRRLSALHRPLARPEEPHP